MLEGDLDTSHFSFLHMPAPGVPSNANPDATTDERRLRWILDDPMPGFEIVEQLGWRYPRHVVCPVAGGTLLPRIGRAFEELKTLGWADGELPRMHAVQAFFDWAATRVKDVPPGSLWSDLSGPAKAGMWALWHLGIPVTTTVFGKLPGWAGVRPIRRG